MGAVSSILFASNPSNVSLIHGLILDSPFNNFKKMIHDIVMLKAKLPGCCINIVLHFLMKTIKKKTGVNLLKIKPI